MKRLTEEQLRRFCYLLGLCPDCGEAVVHAVDEPFADCGCGTSEWVNYPLPLLQVSGSVVDPKRLLSLWEEVKNRK
jgi:hypothetical protein